MKSHAAFNHWIEERLLDRTGIPTTHLRPTFFAEWFIYPGHLAQINSGLLCDSPFAPVNMPRSREKTRPE